MTENEMREAMTLVEQLLLAFPAGRTPGLRDMQIILPVYVEAVEAFEIKPVREALKALRMANPRNPFPPTPQDVYERLRDATGRDPKKPQMLLSEWLKCETAKIIGHEQAMKLWDEKLSPEAKARAALRLTDSEKTSAPLCLAAPDEKRPS